MSGNQNGNNKAQDQAKQRQFKKKSLESRTQFMLYLALGLLYFADTWGLDWFFVKAIATVGFWFGQDWQGNLVGSVGTFKTVVVLVAVSFGCFLSKQKEYS